MIFVHHLTGAHLFIYTISIIIVCVSQEELTLIEYSACE